MQNSFRKSTRVCSEKRAGLPVLLVGVCAMGALSLLVSARFGRAWGGTGVVVVGG